MNKAVDRVEKFIASYLQSGNIQKSAIEAGYSPRSAHVTGHRLLKTAKVRAALEKATAPVRERLTLTVGLLEEHVRRVLSTDARALFDADGNAIPIHKLTDEGAALVAGFEVVKRNLTAGDGAVDTVIKVKLKDQAKYADLAGKHFGWLTDKLEVSGGLDIRWKDTEE